MAKCSLCNSQITQGRGIIYVEMSGRIMNFCSSKCRKNYHMGRVAKKLKWISKAEEQE